VELIVEPEEIAVAARDGEFRVAVAFGGSLRAGQIHLVISIARGRNLYLCRHRILGMRAGDEVPNLVWVPDGDLKRGLCCLLDAHARLCLPLGSRAACWLDRRRDSGSCRRRRILIVII
jgi:hypothetical protein